MGSDGGGCRKVALFRVFQSTLPGWGATANSAYTRAYAQISIHAPRMGSDFQHSPKIRLLIISIHAPRMGSDATFRADLNFPTISIHAPRMGSDYFDRGDSIFLQYFNPRSPDGERLFCVISSERLSIISIHAPRMGSDRENGHLRPRYGQNHLFSTLIVSQIVIDVLGTVRKSQKHQRTSHYEVIKQPERRK